MPLPKIQDPRERIAAGRLARLRKMLGVSEAEFAAAMGVSVVMLAAYEAQSRAWPGEKIANALVQLSGLVAAAQTRIEESAALCAELEESAADLA